MRVLALTPYPRGVAPGQRSSIELWDGVLRGAGIEVNFLPFAGGRLYGLLDRPGHHAAKLVELARGCGQRVRTVREAKRFDAFFVYREAALIGPAVIERLVGRTGVPVIYQLDDPLHVPYRSPTNGWLSYLKCFGKVRTICRISRTVLVNSSALERFARENNDNVWRIPSLVGPEYTYVPPGSNGRLPCIGWTGSVTTARNLGLVAGALRRLAGRAEHSVHLIGADATALAGVNCTAQPWRAETEVADLRRFDIGLLPVPDSPWNHWKFFQKAAQYMALGIPPVCTPIGSNPEVVQHGVTGLLASTEDDWVDALDSLVTDPELRRSMGERAASVAAARYSLAANASRVVDAFWSTWR